jgi:hypothetical protein
MAVLFAILALARRRYALTELVINLTTFLTFDPLLRLCWTLTSCFAETFEKAASPLIPARYEVVR